MLNRIIVMGWLTRDPELRHTAVGTAVASFSIACDRDFKDKATGERATDFIDIVAWRSTGEFVSKYFSKGRMAVVSGRLQLRDWTDKEGNKCRSAEIVAEDVYFGDSKKDSQAPRPAPGALWRQRVSMALASPPALPPILVECPGWMTTATCRSENRQREGGSPPAYEKWKRHPVDILSSD